MQGYGYSKATLKFRMESFVEHLEFLKRKAAGLRIDLVKMLHHAGSGHLGGSLSVMEILVALYYGRLQERRVLFYDASKPGSQEQDYFVLSKGHACAALYTVLADCGFYPKDELMHYRQVGSMLQAYPVKKIPGIALSTGTPAYGAGGAVGLALALKMDKSPNRVVCLAGDGELQEGQLWESVMLAAQYKLDNLTLIVDWNGLQMDGAVRSVVGIEPIADKFESFGWKIVMVADGHSFEDLLIGMEKAYETQRRPTALIARTVKGKGVAFAENKPFYHAEVLSDEELDEALPALEYELKSLLNQENK